MKVSIGVRETTVEQRDGEQEKKGRGGGAYEGAVTKATPGSEISEHVSFHRTGGGGKIG